MSEAAFELAGRLTRSGSPSPGPEARIIVAHVLGVEVPRLIAVDDVTAEQQRCIDELAERRMAGEPLQHLTGVAYFRHEELLVGPGVFIPRPETEVMVGWALQRLAERDTRRVVELCAGSGAISAALATELGGLELYAVELDPEAFAFLERNLEGRGVDLVRGDMATALPELDGTVDLVIVNPPYVPERLRPFLPERCRRARSGARALLRRGRARRDQGRRHRRHAPARPRRNPGDRTRRLPSARCGRDPARRRPRQGGAARRPHRAAALRDCGAPVKRPAAAVDPSTWHHSTTLGWQRD